MEGGRGKKNSKICNAPVIRRRISNKNIILHEDYDYPKHDIALIGMKNPVPLYQEDPKISSVSPICLPWSYGNSSYAYSIGDGDSAIIAGRGSPFQKSRDEANAKLINVTASVAHLSQVRIPIANDQCNTRAATRGLGRIDFDRQICAGGEKG